MEDPKLQHLNEEDEQKRVDNWQKKLNKFVQWPYISPQVFVKDLTGKEVHKFQGPEFHKFEGPSKDSISPEEEDLQESLFPIVVPIGPPHYDIAKSSFFMEGNVLKIDALRFVIDNGDPLEEDWEKRFQTLIQHMVSKEEEIRKYYELSQISQCLKGEIFAWLTIVDCCFLLAMWSVLSEEIKPSEGSFYSDYVKDDDILQKLIEDMIKLQNQMPLWVVKEVAQGLPGWEPQMADVHFISGRVHMPNLLKKINPHGNEGADFFYPDDDTINSSHLLHLLHYDVVGNPDNQNMPSWGWEEHESTTSLTKKILFECRGFLQQNVVLVVLLPFIFPLLIALALPAILVAYILPHPARKGGGIASLRAEYVFLFLQNMEATQTSMLELPNLITEKSMGLPMLIKASEKEQVLIKNMIALERYNPQIKKRVSNFVCFMSEFLETPDDVELLETANILGINVEENKVVGMWKSLAKSASYHTTPYKDPYDPITMLRRNLSKLTKPSRQAVMWYRLGTWYGEFKKQYFSNAWVTVSTVAATILLLMTAAQVACLFVTCSRF